MIGTGFSQQSDIFYKIKINYSNQEDLLKLANNGFTAALRDDPGFCEGLSVCNGHLTIAAVAEEHGYEYISPMELINQG